MVVTVGIPLSFQIQKNNSSEKESVGVMIMTVNQIGQLLAFSHPIKRHRLKTDVLQSSIIITVNIWSVSQTIDFNQIKRKAETVLFSFSTLNLN